MTYFSDSETKTEQIGYDFALTLAPGTVIALRGDLGAGKTAFVRGMARALGCDQRVTSPTYTIVNEYGGNPPLIHFDLYRLSGADELYDLGWDDYLDRGAIIAVEWYQRAFDTPESGTYLVDIEKDGDLCRSISIGRASCSR